MKTIFKSNVWAATTFLLALAVAFCVYYFSMTGICNSGWNNWLCISLISLVFLSLVIFIFVWMQRLIDSIEDYSMTKQLKRFI